MSLEGIKIKMKIAFPEQVFKTHGVDQESQDHIASPRGRIPECLQIHQFPEGGIKKINYRKDKVTDVM